MHRLASLYGFRVLNRRSHEGIQLADPAQIKCLTPVLLGEKLNIVRTSGYVSSNSRILYL